MDEKTPEEKRKSEEPEFTLEPVQKESKTEEPEFTLETSPDAPEENTGLTLEAPEEEPQQEKPSFTLEHSETKAQPEEPKTEEPEFTLETSPDQPEEPQLNLEPPKEKTQPEEPQLDLEPPKKEAQPKADQTEQKPIEELVVDTEIDPSPPSEDNSHDDDKKSTQYGKGVSRRFDPRRTKVRENGEEKFEPQISFAKGTAQDGPAPRASAAVLKNPKIIIPAAIALIIIVAVLIFMFKPDSPPVEPQKKLPKKTAIKKKPAQKKQAVVVKEKKEATPPAIQYKKYSNNVFSLKLPEGYKTATDPSTNVNKLFFLYGKNIKVQIIYWKQNREWNPEEMMYNKIEEVQKEKTSSNALRVNNYGLINISGCRGYEIVMSGIRNYTFSKAKIYSLYGKGKIFLIDIDCKNSKDPDVLKIFNAVNNSIAKTLKIK